MKQLRRLSVFVLQRRVYSRLRATVELVRFIDFVLFVITVRYRIVSEQILIVFACDGLYGGWRTGAVLFPKCIQTNLITFER